MYPHHEETIEKLGEYFGADPSVEALLLVGSIAHGFETPGSDVDVMLLVSAERYGELAQHGRLTVYNKELCSYQGGYVDGKYVSMSFLEEVAARGSEPARFAFEGARVLFTRTESLESTLGRIVRFPVEGVEDRLCRFSAQLEAWYWYFGEALRQENRYLQWLSVSKLVLFGGRLMLAHNRTLYPYHKWFLRVLEGVKERPADLLGMINRLYETPTADNARNYYEAVKQFRDWGLPLSAWPTQFVKDVELSWQSGFVPVDDL